MILQFRTKGVYEVGSTLARSCMYDKRRGIEVTAKIDGECTPSTWQLVGGPNAQSIDLRPYFYPRGTWPERSAGTHITVQISIPFNTVQDLLADDASTFEVVVGQHDGTDLVSDRIFFIRDKEMIWHES